MLIDVNQLANRYLFVRTLTASLPMQVVASTCVLHLSVNRVYIWLFRLCTPRDMGVRESSVVVVLGLGVNSAQRVHVLLLLLLLDCRPGEISSIKT